MLSNAVRELERMGVNFVEHVEMARILESSSVLFEGAQGVMLDIDCGTYPYVTSSNTAVSGIYRYLNVRLDRVYGVFKAYTTRVGEGPFPTEMSGKVSDEIRERERGHGATTGRPRRVGWLDLVALEYAVECSGVTDLVFTKAAVLFGMKRVKIAVAYSIDGWKGIGDENFERFVSMIEKRIG